MRAASNKDGSEAELCIGHRKKLSLDSISNSPSMGINFKNMEITLGQLSALAMTIDENETLRQHIKDDRQTIWKKLKGISQEEKRRINYLRFNKHYSILLKELKEKYDIT